MKDTVSIGVSLGMDIINLVVLEAGGELLFFQSIIDSIAYDLFFRGGLMPTVIDTRGSTYSGSTLQLGGLVGYRYSITSDHHDGNDRYSKYHSFSLGGGIDYTGWIARNFGICLRLLIDAEIPFYQVHSPDSIYHKRNWVLSVGLAFGLAF
ncbi:MAG: hypothetical protein GY854_11430 [Deltaproteobacteria bacterium]|nr:hypothetical protein [Deltaproteobacteria bacterium]